MWVRVCVRELCARIRERVVTASVGGRSAGAGRQAEPQEAWCGGSGLGFRAHYFGWRVGAQTSPLVPLHVVDVQPEGNNCLGCRIQTSLSLFQNVGNTC